MTDMGWIVAGVGLAVLLGLVLLAGGRRLRRRLGLGEGRTVALDNDPWGSDLGNRAFRRLPASDWEASGKQVELALLPYPHPYVPHIRP